MSRLQLKSGLKKGSVWREFAAFSVLLHVVILFALLVVYKGSSEYRMTVRAGVPRNVPVIFMPMHKSMNKFVAGSGAPQQSTSASETIQKNTMQKSATAPAVKKAATSLAHSSPAKKSMRGAQQGARKKTVQKPATKKQAPQKGAQQTAKNKKEIKKPEPVIKKEEPVAQQPEQAVVPANVCAHAEIASPGIEVGPEGALLIGQQEMAALEMTTWVQEAVAESWQPPTGLPEDLQCEIAVTVNWEGEIAEVNVVRSSGVSMYDMSAKQALHSFKAPQWAHGKTLTISFVQT